MLPESEGKQLTKRFRILANHPGLLLRLILRCEIKACRAEQYLLMISAYTFNQLFIESRTEAKVAGEDVKIFRATVLIALPSLFVSWLVDRRTSLWL